MPGRSPAFFIFTGQVLDLIYNCFAIILPDRLFEYSFFALCRLLFLRIPKFGS